MAIFNSYVKLPEGKPNNYLISWSISQVLGSGKHRGLCISSRSHDQGSNRGALFSDKNGSHRQVNWAASHLNILLHNPATSFMFAIVFWSLGPQLRLCKKKNMHQSVLQLPKNQPCDMLSCWAHRFFHVSSLFLEALIGGAVGLIIFFTTMVSLVSSITWDITPTAYSILQLWFYNPLVGGTAPK